MAEQDKAQEARQGLLDSVAGKAKEVAGALTGKDDLAQEGQLQQADAQTRKQANSREAVADAARGEAVDELHEEQQQAIDQRREAYAEAGRRQQAVAQDADSEKAAAEADARVHEQLDRARAAEHADDVAREGVVESRQLRDAAAADEAVAAANSRRLEAEAADDERRAAELRARTQTD